MENIQKFSNVNAMWDGFAGCIGWPEIKGKENDGYREPIFAYVNEEILIIVDSQCAQAHLYKEDDEDYCTLDWKFETQAEAIEYLKMINPTQWRHFQVLGYNH